MAPAFGDASAATMTTASAFPTPSPSQASSPGDSGGRTKMEQLSNGHSEHSNFGSTSGTASTTSATSSTKKSPIFNPKLRDKWRPLMKYHAPQKTVPKKKTSTPPPAPPPAKNPHDIYEPGDRITCYLKKESTTQDPGLTLKTVGNRCYVHKVEGLCKQRLLPMIPGDEVIFLNEKSPSEWKGADNMNKAMQVLHVFKIVLIRGGDVPSVMSGKSFASSGTKKKQPTKPFHNNKKKKKTPPVQFKKKPAVQFKKKPAVQFKKKKIHPIPTQPKSYRPKRQIVVEQPSSSDEEEDDDDNDKQPQQRESKPVSVVDDKSQATTSTDDQDDNDGDENDNSGDRLTNKKNKKPKHPSEYHFVSPDIKRQQELEKQKKKEELSKSEAPVEDYLSSSEEEDDDESAMILPDGDRKLQLNRPEVEPKRNIKPGLIMEMYGIRKRPDLNGIKVDVLERDQRRPKRWKVDYMRGKDRVILSVAEKNLRPLSSSSDEEGGSAVKKSPKLPRSKRSNTQGVIRSSSSDGFSKIRPKGKPFNRASSFVNNRSSMANATFDTPPPPSAEILTPVQSNKGSVGGAAPSKLKAPIWTPGPGFRTIQPSGRLSPPPPNRPTGKFNKTPSTRSVNSSADSSNEDASLPLLDVQPGDHMILRSLRSQPQWNGMEVQVLKKDDLFKRGDRWQVKIITNNEIVSVGNRNLLPMPGGAKSSPINETPEQVEFPVKPGDTLVLQKLRSQPHWNGKVVKILKKDDLFPKGDRWQVEMVDDKEIVSIKRENLAPYSGKTHEKEEEDDDDNDGFDFGIQPGDKMELRHLRSQPQLNGRTVTVIEKDTENPGSRDGSSRWQVELEGPKKERISVTKKNLLPIKDKKGWGYATILSTSPTPPSRKEAPPSNAEGPTKTADTSKTQPQIQAQASDIKEMLKPGEMMKLQNLRSQPQWNGKVVKILEHDMFEKGKRYRVEILETKEEISIKRDNMVPASTNEISEANASRDKKAAKVTGKVERSDMDFEVQDGDVMKLKGIRSQPQWNGKSVRVLKKDEGNADRWKVEIVDEGEVVSVGKRNLVPLDDDKDGKEASGDFTVGKGDMIRLHSLRSQPQWNGKAAKVLKKDGTAAPGGERWQVQLLVDKEVVSVGKKNMRLVSKRRGRPKRTFSISSLGSCSSVASIDSTYDIQAGEYMKLGHLINQPQWNGKVVKILQQEPPSSKGEQYKVEILGSKETLSVGRRNLFTIRKSRRSSLSSASSVSSQEDHPVATSEPANTAMPSRQTPNFTVKVGEMLKLDNIGNRPEMNGRVVEVQKKDDATTGEERWQVEVLGSRELISVATKNLRPLHNPRRSRGGAGSSSDSVLVGAHSSTVSDRLQQQQQNLNRSRSPQRPNAGAVKGNGPIPRSVSPMNTRSVSPMIARSVAPMKARSVSPKTARSIKTSSIGSSVHKASSISPVRSSSSHGSSDLNNSSSHRDDGVDLSFPVQPGEMMTLRNIRSQPKWNGKTVRILKKDDVQLKGERWQVEILDLKETVSIAKKNLLPMSREQQHASSSSFVSNGGDKSGSVPDSFSIRDGAILRLTGLRSQPQWNGKPVKVLSKDNEFKMGDRWKVEILDSHDVVSVPKKNLLPR